MGAIHHQGLLIENMVMVGAQPPLMDVMAAMFVVMKGEGMTGTIHPLEDLAL